MLGRPARWLLVLAATGSLLASGAPAAATFPYPSPPPGTDPYDYPAYTHTAPGQTPNDYTPSSGDYWKYTSTPSGDPSVDSNPQELAGVRGASVDKAWEVTTGRPDVLLAVLDSGIRWGEANEIRDLVTKFYLNPGELPPPRRPAMGQPLPRAKEGSKLFRTFYDPNRDGVFNVLDYCQNPFAPARCEDPRAADLNGNGLIDPEDLIFTFSDGRDDDGNGYTDDISGWDFLEDDNDPLDEVAYGHGTGESRDSSAEADNSSGFPGTCPNCMLLEVRVGDSFIADANDFAQGVIFAVDSGAKVVQEALGTLNNSALGRAAVDYAWSRGVLVVASAADEEAGHHNYPSTYDHAITVNSVTKFPEEGGVPLMLPRSYLYLNGCTNFGARMSVSVPSASCSSEATGRSAGIAGLVYSAAMDAAARGAIRPHPELGTPISANEAYQVLTRTADDVDFATPRPPFGPPYNYAVVAPVPTRRFPSGPGFDPYFGYGRVNAWRAVKAVAEGRIPPEADITSPGWFDLLDPAAGSVEVRGTARALRSESFRYEVAWAPGLAPSEADYRLAYRSPILRRPVEGRLATLDLSSVAVAVPHEGPPVDPLTGQADPDRFSFTLRLKVADSRGLVGEDRVALFLHHDPDLLPGFPRPLTSDATVGPKFADLDADGAEELVFGTSDGWVHALKPDGSEAQGWPVHTTPLYLHTGSPAFRSGALPSSAYAAVLGAVAVGDLDRDGYLEVVAADMEGRVYAWNYRGAPLPGFPVRSDPAYSGPQRRDREAGYFFSHPEVLSSLAAESRLPLKVKRAPGEPGLDPNLLPDAVHRLDNWNRLDWAFFAGPALGDLDGDGRLEILAGSFDRHAYAWRADGTPLPGWPVLLRDPDKVKSVDPVTHHVRFREDSGVKMGTKIVTPPTLSDLTGDGRPEILVSVNEEYAEEPNASLTSNPTFSLLGRVRVLESGNTRVYALRPEGTLAGEPHPTGVPAQAYLPGWPVRAAALLLELLPVVGTGPLGSPVVARRPSGSPAIALYSHAGPAYVFGPNGVSIYGRGPDGKDRGLSSDSPGPGSSSLDFPSFAALSGGAFFRSAGKLYLAAGAAGLGKALDVLLPADQLVSENHLAVWDVEAGLYAPGFPALVNDLQFFASPAAVDVDGDGSPEVLEGSAYYDLHAFRVPGAGEPAGWPKLTGGWVISAPATGDFLGDGSRVVALVTREGWLLAWRTGAGVCSGNQWPEYHHDGWNTGDLDRDASSPGAVLDLKAELVAKEDRTGLYRLAWTAPGGDGRCGQASRYHLRVARTPPRDPKDWGGERELPLGVRPAPAGTRQEVTIRLDSETGKRPLCFALQSEDAAGNLSPFSQPACARGASQSPKSNAGERPESPRARALPSTGAGAPWAGVAVALSLALGRRARPRRGRRPRSARNPACAARG